MVFPHVQPSLFINLYMHVSLQISYTYGSGVLNDKNTYKRLFQTFPSSDYFPLAILSLMKFFTWSRVVFVTENESPFLQVNDEYKYLVLVWSSCSMQCTHTSILSKGKTLVCNLKLNVLVHVILKYKSHLTCKCMYWLRLYILAMITYTINIWFSF